MRTAGTAVLIADQSSRPLRTASNRFANDGLLFAEGRALRCAGTDDIRWVGENNPHVRLVEMPACGHGPFIEEREQYLAELLGFLDEIR